MEGVEVREAHMVIARHTVLLCKNALAGLGSCSDIVKARERLYQFLTEIGNVDCGDSCGYGSQSSEEESGWTHVGRLIDLVDFLVFRSQKKMDEDVCTTLVRVPLGLSKDERMMYGEHLAPTIEPHVLETSTRCWA